MTERGRTGENVLNREKELDENVISTLGSGPQSEEDKAATKEIWRKLNAMRPSGQPAAAIPKKQHVIAPDGCNGPSAGMQRVARSFAGGSSYLRPVVLAPPEDARPAVRLFAVR